MESASSESALSFPLKSQKSILSTTPQKPLLAPADIFTPERSDSLPRIRNQKSALSISNAWRTETKLRKVSPIGSGLLDLDQTTEKLPSGRAAPERPKSSQESSTLLPEKHEVLCEFFNAMVSSIRLLRLKRLPSTFSRLCHYISSLTNRRFTLHHVAQLKHVVPEVIMVKKIRVQDEETHCMNEELLITLEKFAAEVNKKETGAAGFAHLKSIFQSRITDYSTNHPEGDDIPEGELPQLFYKAKQDSEPSMSSSLTLVRVSHIASSFKRRFSSRVLSGSVPKFSPPKASSCLSETPIKVAVSTKASDGASSTSTDIEGTPVKLASTPARLMSTTPALRQQKRAFMSPDHYTTNDLSNKSARLSLNFDKSCGDLEEQSSQTVDNEANLQGSSTSMDILNLLPDHLVQSLAEKERKILEEQDPIMSQARRREQLIAGVPKLFDMICLLFQSIRRSVITKEELIHKIVAGHLDIVDKREVEEQLNLLLEVAPEYMSEKSCLSGDIILQFNKFSSPESIRAKLLDTK